MDRVVKLLGLLLVFAAGIAASVIGFARLALVQDLDASSILAAGGLALVAWVIFHPARVPEDARPRSS